MNPTLNVKPVTEPVTTNYAGFWRRLLATIIDGGIIGIITITLQSALGQDPFAVFDAKTLQELEVLNNSPAYKYNSLIAFAFGIAYTLIFWTSYEGATPGKKLLGIKIVKEDGKGITVPTGVIRYLGYLLSGFCIGLGFLWVLWDKKKQGWHDKLASTLVIKDGKKGNIGLAIFLAIIMIIGWGGFYSTAVYKGFTLGYAEVKNKQNASGTALSYQESLEKMNPEAKVHYENSMKLFEEMRANQADSAKVIQLNDQNIQELQLALEKDPKNPRLWIELGNANTWVSTKGSLESGLAAFSTAEKIDPQNVVYINNVGDMLIRMGQYDKAILQFQKTLRITDNSGYANLSLGIAYQRLAINDSAATHYEKAIEIFTKQNAEGNFDDEILEARKGLSEVKK